MIGAISMNIQPEKKIVCRLKGSKEIKEDVVDVSKLRNKKAVKGMVRSYIYLFIYHLFIFDLL